MSNIVSLKIQIEGSETIKTVSFSADELASALNKVRDSSDKLNGSIVNWSQAGQAAEMLESLVGGLTTAFSGLTAAYAEQEAGETRLAQAMRNTMDATKEDIEAIKSLCSAQQALGIIGDEVQLSGAQELATYLEKRSSLERLIPVMNDMLAQQYEYNATSESAAQIASMLGKVMNGQTEALSRYGYKFDEAQKHILQFGSEEERAAVLAEVVQQSVGGMNAEMALTPVGRMKQLSNTFGDFKEQLGAVATKITPVLQSLAALTTTATGVGKLVSSVKSLNAALKASQISAKSLKMVMGGIAGIALTAAITAFTLLGNKTREAQEAAEKANEEYKEMQGRLASARSEIELDIQKLSSFSGSLAEEQRLVQEMNDKWGATFGTFSTVSDWYKTLSENVDAYCTQLARQIELEKIANDIANAKINNQQLESQLSDLKAKRESVNGQTMITGGGEMGMASPFNVNSTSGYDKDISRLEAAVKSNGDIIARGEDRMHEILSEMANITSGSSGGGGLNVGSLEADIEAYRKSIQEAVQINNIFNEGQQPLVARMRAMESGITSLIRKYGAENESVKQLIDEYLTLSALKGGPALNMPGAAVLGAGGLRPSAKDFIASDFDWSAIGTDGLLNIQDAAAGATTAIGALSNTMSSLSGIVGESASSWLSWGAGILQAVAQALPALHTLFEANTAVAGSGAAASTSSIPVVGPVMAIAAMAGIAASIAQLPKFAAGGLAYGPTLGLFGEYPGAAHNPEVVAPLSRLPSLLGGFGGGKVEFVIKGRTLQGILNNMDRFDSRSNG